MDPKTKNQPQPPEQTLGAKQTLAEPLNTPTIANPISSSTEQNISQNHPQGPEQVQPMQFCRYCGATIFPNVYYCPNCGKKLKNPPLSTSISAQIKVYTFAVLLPPLGIIPAVRYLVSKEKHAKTVGIITLVLTIIMTYISYVLFIQIMGSYNKSMSQFNELQNLGY